MLFPKISSPQFSNRRAIYYDDCLKLKRIDRLCYNLSSGQVNDAYQQALGRMPTSGELNSAVNNSSWDGSAGQNSLIAQLNPQIGQQMQQQQNAQKLIDMAQQAQLKANQPAIQTLETQYNPSTGTGALVDQYNDLLTKINAAEQPAIDVATQGVGKNLAASGIVSENSGIGNQYVQGVTNPITSQFGQLISQTGLSKQQDLASLAGNIANLQAGNIPNALNFSSNIAGQENQLAGILAGIYGPQQLAPNNEIVNPVTGQVYASNIPANLFNATSGNTGDNSKASNVTTNSGAGNNNFNSTTSSNYSGNAANYANPIKVGGQTVYLGGANNLSRLQPTNLGNGLAGLTLR